MFPFFNAPHGAVAPLQSSRPPPTPDFVVKWLGFWGGTYLEFMLMLMGLVAYKWLNSMVYGRYNELDIYS